LFSLTRSHTSHHHTSHRPIILFHVDSLESELLARATSWRSAHGGTLPSILVASMEHGGRFTGCDHDAANKNKQQTNNTTATNLVNACHDDAWLVKK
jgi:hypothetical protein